MLGRSGSQKKIEINHEVVLLGHGHSYVYSFFFNFTSTHPNKVLITQFFCIPSARFNTANNILVVDLSHNSGPSHPHFPPSICTIPDTQLPLHQRCTTSRSSPATHHLLYRDGDSVGYVLLCHSLLCCCRRRTPLYFAVVVVTEGGTTSHVTTTVEKMRQRMGTEA